MINGTDYYLCAASYDLLAGMLTTVQGGFIQLAYQNVIGPMQANNLWYVAIRITDGSVITLPTGVAEDDINGPLVLGVWA
jgi:hypothetical protein